MLEGDHGCQNRPELGALGVRVVAMEGEQQCQWMVGSAWSEARFCTNT